MMRAVVWCVICYVLCCGMFDVRCMMRCVLLFMLCYMLHVVIC